MLIKSIKWTAIALGVCGLTNCMMMDEGRDLSPQSHSVYDSAPAKQASTVKTTTVSKVAKSSATEPVQKSTPGPKRAAAPQLPVIQ